MTRELGDRMVADERFKLLTFTGSPSVGWRMKERAGKKKVVLELGGNAGVIVDETADLDWAVKRSLVGAFTLRRPGLHQRPARCSSTRTSGTTFLERFVDGAKDSKVGDPLDPKTQLGPMVDATAAGRTQRWVRRGGRDGRHGPAGGTADGAFFPPTVLTDVPPTAQVCSNEAFAPLVVAFPFDDFDEAIAGVNDSMFGLQTGVFTNDLGGRVAGVQRARGRRGDRQRRPDLPDRPHALRRRQGFRPRARGPALGDRGHDRDPDHGARPAVVSARAGAAALRGEDRAELSPGAARPLHAG